MKSDCVNDGTQEHTDACDGCRGLCSILFQLVSLDTLLSRNSRNSLCRDENKHLKHLQFEELRDFSISQARNADVFTILAQCFWIGCLCTTCRIPSRHSSLVTSEV